MSVQRLSRRRFIKGIGAAVSAVFLTPPGNPDALAGDGPCPQVSGRAIRWVVPAPAGGGFDTYSRLIAPFYARNLGAKIVFDYMPGAGGIVGAKAVKEAAPDGLTQGLLDAPGLMVSAMAGETDVPSPVKDFTVLARLVQFQQIWAVRGGSPFKTVDDVLAEAQKKPVLFSVEEVGSAQLISAVVTTSLLGINADFVAGYQGARGVMLALMRGEVDLITCTSESHPDMFRTGELRALLQITTEPIPGLPFLQGVPLLGGDNGLAARRAAELGRDVEEAKKDAAALAGLMGGGRLVVAPPGMDRDLSRCLERELQAALTDPGFKAAAAGAGRSADPTLPGTAVAELKAAAERGEKFIPMVKEAIKKVQR